MSNEALKPCPFCGGKPINTRDTTFDKYWVFCSVCFASGPHMKTKEEAIAAWNKRVKDTER
jgi:Lar family restriction alleviation protein